MVLNIRTCLTQVTSEISQRVIIFNWLGYTTEVADDMMEIIEEIDEIK
jgi:hypothetical protein